MEQAWLSKTASLSRISVCYSKSSSKIQFDRAGSLQGSVDSQLTVGSLNNNSSSSPVTCWDLFFLSLDSSGWDCLSHIPFVLEHAVGYTSRSGTGYNVPEHDLGLFLPHSSSMVKAFQKYPEVAEGKMTSFTHIAVAKAKRI